MSSFFSNSYRIAIQKEEIQIINGRRTTPKLIDWHKCWAEVLSLYGKELYEAMDIRLENTIIFKIRYYKKLEALRDYKNFVVSWQGRKYQIYYSDFLNNNKHWIKLKCNEVR